MVNDDSRTDGSLRDTCRRGVSESTSGRCYVEAVAHDLCILYTLVLARLVVIGTVEWLQAMPAVGPPAGRESWQAEHPIRADRGRDGLVLQQGDGRRSTIATRCSS